MPAPYTFPWGLKPLDPMVASEFQRRIKDYGMNPVSSPTDDNPYKGPRTAWIRVFSNGISEEDERNNRPNGFVLGGTEGFNESYGFSKDNKITIGVDCYGNKHEIPAAPSDPELGIGSDTPHRPPPSIVSLETEFSGGNNTGFNATCRKTKINWKCYSLTQLEYLAPYFLTPRITVLTEWGWNNFNPASLVDLSSTQTLFEIFQGFDTQIDKRIKDSHGNYDLALGFVTDYGYTMNEFGGFDCYTTITNANYLVEGKGYQNRQDFKGDPNNASGSIKLKDFTEFVFDDMENLTIKNTKAKNITVNDGTGVGSYSGASNFAATKQVNPVKTVRDDSTDISGLKTKDRVFKDDNDQWLRMDLVADIINKFFEIKFLDPNNKEVGVKAGTLVIERVPVCAHPAIKSTNPNFIIPNQYAPRFVAKDVDGKAIESSGRKRLHNVKKVGAVPSSDGSAPNGEYLKLFPDVKKVLIENDLDNSYDDLVMALITSNARPKYGSFPQYKDYEDAPSNISSGYPRAGYWGYLEDIFVSVKYFKGLVEKHETVLRLIEELLQGISEAMCNICQLQLKPDTKGNDKKFVIDNNFTPVGDSDSAAKLPRFTLNAVDHSFMRSNSINIKISSDMVNQMVMQSANKKPIPAEHGTATYDPKTMKYSLFQRGDRLFNCGVFTPTKPEESNKSGQSEKQKWARMFTPKNSDFYIYRYNPATKNKTKTEVFVGKVLPTSLGGVPSMEDQIFILAETNSNFMKSVVLNPKYSNKATYTNNGIMPGTDFKMEFLGLGGITFLSQFTLSHVPRAYNYQNAVWQISDVKHKVDSKVWTTSITAQARPLITLKEKA